MAIVQISKVQARTGANVDLPQLDVGELGYATDEGKLYIGNDPAEPLPTIDGKYISEILTTTSSLDFSRLNGSDNVSMDMTSVSSGELLGISVSGNIATVVNVGGDAGGEINLGDASNVKISGNGVVGGYVLASDGNGGLTWVTNGVLKSVIQSIGNASGTALFTTQGDHLFGTGTICSVTNIQPSGVQGIIQVSGVDDSNKFYVNRRSSNTFSLHKAANAMAGNLPYDIQFANYTANSGSIVGMITPSGNISIAGTSNTQLFFNDTGATIGGSSNLTFNKTTSVLTLIGNITTTNANLGNAATANYFIGSFRGAVGNAATANAGTFTTVIANNSTVSGNIDVGGNLDVTGNITFDSSSGANVTATGFMQLPVYADDTARDAAILSPSEGMMIFNQSGAKFQGYDGTDWVNLN
jgi:hypothetical protein